jgi:peptide/nickel transport system substrate-binding protein
MLISAQWRAWTQTHEASRACWSSRERRKGDGMEAITQRWSASARVVGAVVLTAFVAVFAASASPAANDAGQTVRIVQASAVTSFYDGIQPSRPVLRVTRAVLDTVTGQKFVNGEPVAAPLLATSWKQLKAKEWLFNVRRGVKFSDGEPLTAASIAASINTIRSDPTAIIGPYLSGFTIKTVGTYAFDVTTTVPNLSILPLQLSIMPVFAPKVMASLGTSQFGLHPVGTGPYVVDSFQPGVSITLSRNPNYWGPKPAIPNVQFTFVSDPSTRVSELESGQADLVESVPYLLQGSLLNNPNTTIRSSRTMTRLVLGFNSHMSPTDNLDIRQAVNYAINRAQIISQIFHGQATPMYGIFVPGESGYNASYQPYPYNPAKALQLVASSGIKNPTFPFIYSPSTTPAAQSIAEMVQSQLKAVGINLELQPAPTQLAGTGFTKGGTPGFYLDQSGLLYPVSPLLFTVDFAPTSAERAINGLQALNGYQQRGEMALDPAKQATIFAQAQKIAITDHALWAPLLVLHDEWGVTKNLKWTPLPNQEYNVATMSFTK